VLAVTSSDLSATSGVPTSDIRHLRAGGVSVVVDVTRMPSILHWGSDLGDLTPDALQVLEVAGRLHPRASGFDASRALGVLPEAASGWFGSPGITGHRGGRDWSPSFVATGPTTASTSPNGQILVVDANDPDLHLTVRVELELLPSGLVRSRATLTNDDTESYQLDGVNMALPVPSEATEIADFTGRWAKERVAQRHEFTHGSHVRTSRRGRGGFDSQLVYAAGQDGFGFGHGEVWGIHLGWSGNQVVYGERMPSGVGVLGAGEVLLPGELILEPGGSYTTPWLFGSYGVGLDAVTARFHEYLRARPIHPVKPRPVVCNVWEAVYFDHDLGRLVALADAAAAVGVERYVLDDGWFRHRRDDSAGLGDWYVDEGVWPDGLNPLIDHVRGLGMEFGLWFEPEMVNPDSDLARAHPDWILSLPHRMPPQARHQQVLDLGHSDAYAYLLERMDAILTEYDIGYVKWDHNRELVDAGHHPGGTPGVHNQTLALYRLLDELKARHPGLEIESCSSGGGRVDLGIIDHTDRVWGSDCIDALERQAINRGTSSLLPLELIGSHIGSPTSHTTGRTHSLAFRAGTAIFGHLGIEWDMTAMSDADRAELTGWVSLYKQWRGLLHSGRLVRADHPDPAVWVNGVVARDGTSALFSVATMAATVTPSVGVVRFPGLDPDVTYRLHAIAPDGSAPAEPRRRVGPGLPDIVLPGRVLGQAGVQLPPVRPESVLLFAAEAV
jgi:alpha-galactosidase